MSASSKSVAARARARKAAPIRLHLEHLEDRVLLAVRIWSGLGTTDNWTEGANWVGGTSPMPDDSLVFDRAVGNGGQSAKLTSNNDYGPDTRFRTITISDTYSIGGNAISLIEGLVANQVSGTAVFNVDVTMVAAQTFATANAGAKLVLSDINTGNLLTLSLDGPGDTQIGDGTPGNAGVISGDSTVQKYGTGTATFYGTNTYKGATIINQGVLNIRNPEALGAKTGITVVNSYGTLQLEGGIELTNEPIYLYGWGNAIDLDTAGALRSVGTATNTISGTAPIVLPSTDTGVCVDDGGRLRISAPVVGDLANSDVRFNKTGTGTLEFFGDQPNQIVGNFRVVRGTAEFNKDPGKYVTLGSIEVGEYMPFTSAAGEAYGTGGGDNAAKLVLKQDNQFPYIDFLGYNMLTLTVWPSGQVQMQSAAQTIGNLTMYQGQFFSADLDIGTGVLTMLGNLATTAGEGSSYVSPAITITGNKLSMGGNADGWSGVGSMPGTQRAITVVDTQLPDPAVDLRIDAVIDGGSAVSVNRAGAGTLLLTGINTYQGSTWLSPAGTGLTVVGSDQAFGTGPLHLGDGALTTNGAKHIIPNTITLENNPRFFSPADVRVGGVRYDDSGDKGDLTFAGVVTFNADRSIYVLGPNQTITFDNEVLDGYMARAGMGKWGQGNLVFTKPIRLGGYFYVYPDSGTVVLTGTAALPGTATNNPLTSPQNIIQVQDGGKLILDNSSNFVADRIPDLEEVRLVGGELRLIGQAGTTVTETIGQLDVYSNLASDLVSKPGAGGNNVLTVTELVRAGSGAQINFQGIDSPLSATGDNQIVLVNQPLQTGGQLTTGGLLNGIFPVATVQGPSGSYDLATWVSTNAGLKIVPFADYVTDISLAGPTSNVKLTASTASVSRQINALVLEPGVSLSGASTTSELKLTSGNLIMDAGSSLDMPYWTHLAAQTGYAYDVGLTVADDAGRANPATISGIITGAQNITKSGNGMLVLDPHNKSTGQSAPNEFTGALYFDSGILNVRQSGALGAQGANAAANGTFIFANATVELEDTNLLDSENVDVGQELLVLCGTGLNDLGAMRNIAGNNSWAGQINNSGTQIDYVVTDIWRMFPSSGATYSAATFIDVADGTSLKLTGQITRDAELIKLGKGTLELGGIASNTYNSRTRVREGTLVLNKADGVYANSTSQLIQVGDDDPATSPATLRLLARDQIHPDAFIRISSDGTLDMSNTRQIVDNFDLTIGPLGAGQLLLGTTGVLTLETTASNAVGLGNTTINVFTIGADNPTGALIDGGTLNLAAPGVISTAVRTFAVNRGLSHVWTSGVGFTGSDLTVTSAITDGTGLASQNLIKTYYGTMEFGGTTANTYTGVSTVARGTLLLSKNVPGNTSAAMSGPLSIGDEDWFSGGRLSDIVRLARPNQLPDITATANLGGVTASVLVRGSGLLDLNGQNDTFGTANFQYGLAMGAASEVRTGTGTLSLNGNLQSAVAGWPIQAARISGNLSFDTPGSAARTIDVGDQGALQYELIIDANISAPIGITIFKTSAGGLLLNGDNSGLHGDIFHQAGIIGLARDASPLGDGLLSIGGATLSAENGPRTLANFISIDGNPTFGNTGQGGANDLTLTGGATLTGNRNLYVNLPIFVTFTGAIGESYGSANLLKGGPGFMVFEGPVMNSGSAEVTWGGGTLILRNDGTLENASALRVYAGATLEVQASASAVSRDRIRDLTPITISNGAIVYRGAAGYAKNFSIGAVTVSNNYTGAIILEVPQTTPGSSIAANMVSLTTGTGSTVNFVGIGKPLGSTENKLKITTAPTLSNGLFPGWLSSRMPSGSSTEVTIDFPTYTANGVIAAPSADNFVGATGTTNVKITSNQTITANTCVNAVLIQGDGVALSGDPGMMLTIRNGTLITASPYNTFGTQTISVPTVTLQGTPFLITDRKTTTTISSVLAETGTGQITAAGFGQLNLTGNNTFAGALVLAQGTVRISGTNPTDTPLGTTAGATTVVGGARLEIQGPLTVGNEALTLTGAGLSYSSVDRADLSGAIRVMDGSGTVTWGTGTTAISFTNGGNPLAINVRAAADRLVLNGTVAFNADAAGRVDTKYGEGTLEFTGGAANTQTNNPAFTIAEGTVELNKTGIALPMTATITVGDDIGGNDADKLVYAANDQIATGAVISVRSSGLWNLNNKNQSLLNTAGSVATLQLYLFNGPQAAADVTLGGGTLTLGNAANVTAVKVDNYYMGAGAGPTISGAGALALGTTTVASGNIIDGVDSASDADLTISANITGSGHLTRTRRDWRLVLAGDNTNWTNANVFTTSDDNTNAARGELVFTRPEAVGTGTGTINIISGQSLFLMPSVGSDFSLAATSKALLIDGAGMQGEGALRSIRGNNTWAGNITLGINTDTNIGVDSDTLALTGVVTSASASTTARKTNKIFPGTLVLGGGTNNSLNNNVQVYQGQLHLAKTAGVAISGGTLTIGNDAGPAQSDVVKILNSNNQISANTNITIASTGLLDLNNNNLTLGSATVAPNLQLQVGAAAAGTVFTGDTGVLTLAGTAGIQIRNTGNHPLYAPSARIAGGGTLEHGGKLAFGSSLHPLDVNELGPVIDFQIDTPIDATGGPTAGGGFQKTNGGALMLTADNTGYGGRISMNGGHLAFPHASANTAYGGSAFEIQVDGQSGVIPWGTPVGATTVIPNPFRLKSNLIVYGGQLQEQFSPVGGTLVPIARQYVDFQGTMTADGALGTRTFYGINNAGTTISGPGGDGTGTAFDLTATTAYTLTFDVRSNSPMEVSGKIIGDGGGMVSKAGNGMLLLSGNNTYTGNTTISNGILVIKNVNSLGTTAGNTTVASGTMLGLAVTSPTPAERILAENLVLNNVGFMVTGTAPSIGPIPVGSLFLADLAPGTPETTVLSGNILLATTSAIGVQATEDTLVSNGVISSPNATTFTSLFKVQPGSLELGGTAANTYIGGTIVSDGTLILNKAVAGDGVATGPSNIIIGDDAGHDSITRRGKDVVRYASGAASNQIAKFALVTLNSSGLLDLAGQNADIGGLVLTTSGRTISGTALGGSSTVDLGAGTLTLNGTGTNLVTVNTSGYTDATTPAAKIVGTTGQIMLAAGVAPVVQINDTYVPSAAEDLVVAVPINSVALPAGDGTYLNGYFAGLREGRQQFVYMDEGQSLSPAPWLSSNAGGSRIQNTPVMGEVNAATATPVLNSYLFGQQIGSTNLWNNYETWIYSGQIYDADGIFQLAEDIDDQVTIFIDGKRVLRNATSSQISTTGATTGYAGATAAANGNVYGGVTSFGMGPKLDGWHDIEVRFGNGTGAAGANTDVTRGWTTTKGFGFNGTLTTPSWNSADYAIPTGGNLLAPTDGMIRTKLDLSMLGTGTLALTADNPLPLDVAVSGPTLVLRDGGALNQAAAIRVDGGGDLVIDNASGAAAASRIKDDATVRLSGANLALIGAALGGSTEAIGALQLGAGASQITVQCSAPGSAAILSPLSMTPEAGASLSLTSAGAELGSADAKIFFDSLRTATPPTFTGGVLSYATITSTTGQVDLVKDADPAPGDASLAACIRGLGGDYDTDINAPVTGNFLFITGATPTLTAGRAANAILFDGSGVVLNTDVNNLSVTSGLIVTTAAGANTIQSGPGGGLSFAASPMLLAAGDLTINSPITASGDLRKVRAGNLTLGGNNASFTGAATIEQGNLRITNAAALGDSLKGTTVSSGTVLQIDATAGDITLAEPIALLGSQIDNYPGTVTTTQSMPAATLRATGNVTLNADISLYTVTTSRLPLVAVTVDVGAKLVHNGSLVEAQGLNASFMKAGSGTLEVAGSGVYPIRGTLGVLDGTLLLNRNVANSVTPNATLIVGDNEGEFRSADRVVYGPGAHPSDELGGNAVTVLRSALFDAAGAIETIGAMTIVDGKFTTSANTFTIPGITMTGGLVETTGNAMLALTGGVTYTGGQQAAMTGQVNLVNATRAFGLADGPAMYDFDLAANVIGGGTAGRVDRTGAGNLLVRGNNVGLTGTNEVQTLSTPVTATAFNLAFGGMTTPTFTYNVSADEIQAALESLPTIGLDNVLVTKTGYGTFTYTITFQNGMGGQDVPAIFANAVSGTAPTVGTAANGSWSFYNNGAGGFTVLGSDTAFMGTMLQNAGGFWAYGGERSIRQLQNYANTTVVLGGRRDWGGTNPLYIGSLLNINTATGVSAYQVDDPLTTAQIGGNSERQLIVFNIVPTTGSWKIAFNGMTSGAILPGADAAAVRSALLGIPGLPAGADFVVEPLPATAPNGQAIYGFKIKFAGTLSNSDQRLLVVTLSGMPGVYTTVNELLRGGAASIGDGLTNPYTVNALTSPAQIGVNKTGIGKLILGGPSAYGGVTTVAAGVLVIKDGGALGTDYGTATASVDPSKNANYYARNQVYVATNAAIWVDGSKDNGDTLPPINVANRGLIIGPVVDFPRIASGYLNDYQGILRNIAGNNTWSAGPQSEVETVKFSVAPTQGTWTLSFGGATTSQMTKDATVADVRGALLALSPFSAGNLLVDGDMTNGFRLTFVGTLRNAPQARVTSAIGGGMTTTITVEETSRGLDGFDLRARTTATTNNSLVFLGSDAGRLDLEGEIFSLANDGTLLTFTRYNTPVVKVGPGAIGFTGDKPNTYQGDTMVLGGSLILNKAPSQALPATAALIFIGDHIDAFQPGGTDSIVIDAPGQVPDQVINMGPTGRLATTPLMGTRTSNNIQQITFNTTPTQGTWALKLNASSGTPFDVTGIPFNATPFVLEQMINTAWPLGAGTVTVGGAVGNYVVTFLGLAAGAPQSPMIGTASLTPTTTVTITRQALGGLAGNETINAINAKIGPMGGSIIDIAGGQLNLNGNLAVAMYAGGAPTTGVLINGPGKLGLLSATAGAAGVRTITVNSTAASEELKITAPIVDGARVANEVQTIAFRTAPTAGNFKIGYGTAWTGNITFNANAATVQNALNTMLNAIYPSAGGIVANVATVGTAYNYQVTFNSAGALAFLDVADLTVDNSGLTGTTPYTVIETLKGGENPTNEQQFIDMPAGLTRGTWVIMYGGNTSTPIPYNATPDQVETALDQVLDPGGLRALPDAKVQAAAAGDYLVTFQNTSAATDMSRLVVGAYGFLPNNSTQPLVSQQQRGNQNPYAGSFRREGQAGSRIVLDPTSSSTYQGNTTLSAGILNIRNNDALGAGLNYTSVTSGAAVELENNITVTNELFLVNGYGTQTLANATRPTQSIGATTLNSGAIRSVSGNNVIQVALQYGYLTATQPVTLSTASSIGVEAGASLKIVGGMVESGELYKVGMGSLELAGIPEVIATPTVTAKNTFVQEGTLILNKLGNDNAVTGTLYIGDDRSAPGTAVVRYGSGAGANQIIDTGGVIVRGGGLFDLSTVTLGEIQTVTLPAFPTTGTWTLKYGTNDATASLPFTATPAQVKAALLAPNVLPAGGDVEVTNGANLWTYQILFKGSLAGIDVPQLVPGGTASAAVATNIAGGFKTIGGLGLNVGRAGAGQFDTGANTVNIPGNISVYTTGGNPVYAPATVAGHIGLGAASRNLQVWDNPGDRALEMSASIANGLPGAAVAGITKLGGGNALLSGDSTYTGITTVAEGLLLIGGANALGSNAAGTLVSNNPTTGLGSIGFIGDFNYSVPEAITLGNATEVFPWTISHLGGNSVFAGTISAPMATTTTTIPVTINSTGGSLTLGGLVLTGDKPLTTTGAGSVSIGTLTIPSAATLGLTVANASTTVTGPLDVGPITVQAGSALAVNGTTTASTTRTILDQGSLSVGSGGSLPFGTLTIDPGASATFAGTGGGAAATIADHGSLGVDSTGNLTFASLNVDATRTATIAGTAGSATATIDDFGSISVASTGNLLFNTLTIESGATLDVAGAGGSNTSTISDLGTFTVTSGANFAFGSLTVDALATASIGGTAGSDSATILDNGTLAVTSTGNLRFGTFNVPAGVTVNIDGAAGSAAAAMAVSGTLNVNSGANVTLNTLDVPAIGTVSVAGTLGSPTATITDQGNLSVASTGNLQFGSLTIDPGVTLNIAGSGGSATATITDNGTLNISAGANVAFNSLTIDGLAVATIAGTAGGPSASIDDFGTLNLASTTNLQFGSLNVRPGVTLDVAGTAGGPTAIITDSGTLSVGVGATLTFGSLTVETGASASIAGTAGSATATVLDKNGLTVEATGILQFGSLTVDTTGTTTVNGQASGDTILDKGSLVVNGAANLVFGALTVDSGATATIYGTAGGSTSTLTNSGTLTVDAVGSLLLNDLTVEASGVTTINGSTTAATVVDRGTVTVGTTGSLGFNSLTVAAGGQAAINGTAGSPTATVTTSGALTVGASGVLSFDALTVESTGSASIFGTAGTSTASVIVRGTLTVDAAATLKLASLTVEGVGAQATIDSAIPTAPVLVRNSGSLSVGSTGSVPFTTLTLETGGSATIAGSAGLGTSSISDGGSLTVTDTGSIAFTSLTIALSGTASIAGTAGGATSMITDLGSLNVTDTGFLAFRTLTVQGTATIAGLASGNTVNAQGALTVDPTGTLAYRTLNVPLGATADINGMASGTTVLDQGTLNVGSTGNLAFRTLTVDGAGVASIAGTAGQPTSVIDLTTGGDLTVLLGGVLRYNTVAAGSASEVIVLGQAIGTQITGAVGSTVKGTGSVQGSVVGHGTVQGGNDVGTLTLAGSTTLDAGSFFAVDLASAASGDCSQVQVASGGSLVLGNAELQVALAGGFVPAVGNHFTVVKNQTGAPVTGLFYYGGAALNNGDGFEVPLPGGGTVPLRIFYDSGATHDVVLVRQDALAISSVRVDAGAGDQAGGDIFNAAQAPTWESGQRSVINRMIVTFNGIADTIDGDAIALTAQGALFDQGKGDEDRAGAVPISWTSSRVGEQTVVVITFGDGLQTYDRSGVFSLEDDNYTFAIDASKVHVDHGTAMTNFTDNFFRWFGTTPDVIGGSSDRDTDGGDLYRFRSANNPGVNYGMAYDYNGDGIVDNTDYMQFRYGSCGTKTYLRFGSLLLP